jgi:succinyl-diaminopimelate desuccinylase
MSDMRYYASKLEMPNYGFSPDAEFPVINIEKGGMNVLISKVTGGEEHASIPVYSLYAGERPNVVPAEAKAVIGLGAMRLQDLADRLADIEAAHEDFHFTCDEIPGNKAEIVAIGVNAHGAMPHLGVNAAGMLLIALKELGAGSATAAGGGSKEAIAMLADVIGMETTGEKLGIACADELSGALTCNLGILRYDGNEISALLDIRYPLCASEETIAGQAVMRVSPALSVQRAGGHTPLHVPAESRIVQGLLKVYHDVTGLDAYTVAIGGGTYSRTMPNTVAFGVCFPGDMDVCHIADEYMDLDKMMLGVKIFAHAIAELAGA